ncbi:hypothetical protein MGYG_07763 [Nannizzia gypsea CBS 118893]|uniref:PHD-type domain-containing protein n=1 Tax=Arthroderma gypseum (strain ATCC MYA-4604 / CBS 118893) TaxID=535722 RepID=E4V431_ARTGP|nr:hypothetical protein MGYG_07763 [Nannizzia gypsea CBS 118893]EFR04755.1 hypothetical protein MGYG_07763 [Nannizzia gypsea CBS 118893]
MAPRLRSSSRTTSRNNTRPSSPHSAPASRPSSSSTSDTARPKKQRKTGTETRSPVDVVEEEERQAERKPAGSQMDTVLEQPEQAVDPQMAVLSGFQQLATAAGLSTSQDSSQFAGQSSSVLPAPEQSTEPEQQPVPAAAPRADEETWVEPPVAIPKTTCRGYGLNRGGPYGSMLPLGTRPTLAARRRVGLEPPAPTTTTTAAASKVTKRKGGRAAKPKQTPKSADERPTTASTSAEDAAALSDSSRAEGIIQGVLEREERSHQQPSAPAPASRMTRSRAAGKGKLDDSADSNHSAEPAVPSSRKYTSEKLMDILGSAILRAEESDDSKVAGGLRWIKEASASDPFLLGVLEGAINRSADAHHRSAFQALIKDAVKRAQAQPEEQQQQQLDDSAAATDMVRTASATTTSSLSTAKSLDADAFAPVAAEPDSANAPTTTTSSKGKGARATKSRARGGRGRAGPSRANAALPTNSAFSRKRKLEEDPEFSEEAVAAKRRALEEATIAVTDEAEESNVRTAMEPPQGWVFPGPSVPSDSEGQGSTIPAPVAPAPKDKAARQPATVGTSSTSKRVRKPRVQADEIDNIDFCRACGGNGQLLCCDGCVDSFHFTCLQPPVDPKSPPAGQWFCPACEKKGLLGGLAEVMESVPQTGFSLPAEVRDFFAEVETGPGGEYRDVRALPEGSTRATKPARGSRGGVVEEIDPLRVLDAHGKVIACVRCGLSSENRRPVILCDYCPSAWHLDCLDPPMANPPRQKPGSDKPYHYWRCPNHLEDALEEHYPGRVRRPRNPKYVDIDVLPETDEESVIDEQVQEGVVLRVKESGLVQRFITHVLSEHAAEEEARANLLGDETCTQEAGQDEAPSAVPSFSQLGSAEQDAVVSLMDITGNSGAKRAEQLMSGLIAGTPDGFRTSSNELDILRAIQELVGKRITALTPTSEPTN